MRSTLRMTPMVRRPLPNQRHIRRNRRRNDNLCRPGILRSLYSLHNLWRLRSHGNHHIHARA